MHLNQWTDFKTALNCLYLYWGSRSELDNPRNFHQFGLRRNKSNHVQNSTPWRYQKIRMQNSVNKMIVSKLTLCSLRFKFCIIPPTAETSQIYFLIVVSSQQVTMFSSLNFVWALSSWAWFTMCVKSWAYESVVRLLFKNIFTHSVALYLRS